MATKLPATDVVIIGLGRSGSMNAKSMTDASLRVVSIERGPWRDTATDFPPSYSLDELRYAVMSRFLTDKLANIVQRMGPRQIVKLPRVGPFNIVPYQTTHTCGCAIMGTDPKTSAINRYLQSWDVPNLFATGATAFPQNTGYNPTGTIGALTFWSLDAIHKQYLKSPGPLVQT